MKALYFFGLFLIINLVTSCNDSDDENKSPFEGNWALTEFDDEDRLTYLRISSDSVYSYYDNIACFCVDPEPIKISTNDTLKYGIYTNSYYLCYLKMDTLITEGIQEGNIEFSFKSIRTKTNVAKLIKCNDGDCE